MSGCDCKGWSVGETSPFIKKKTRAEISSTLIFITSGLDPSRPSVAQDDALTDYRLIKPSVSLDMAS